MALAIEFQANPFSECTKALRLMSVFAVTQLEDVNTFAPLSGVPINTFINPVFIINHNDQPLYGLVTAALHLARNLAPVAWANALVDANELKSFLLQAQQNGQPDFILGYVLGAASHSAGSVGTDQTPSTQTVHLQTLVQAVLMQEVGLDESNSPPSVANNNISDGEADYIMMNGTESEVTNSEVNSPPWDLGDWVQHENHMLDFAGPAWDHVPVGEGFAQQPMAE